MTEPLTDLLREFRKTTGWIGPVTFSLNAETAVGDVVEDASSHGYALLLNPEMPIGKVICTPAPLRKTP